MIKRTTAVRWRERKHLAGKTEFTEEETNELGLQGILIGNDERGLKKVKGRERHETKYFLEALIIQFCYSLGLMQETSANKHFKTIKW